MIDITLDDKERTALEPIEASPSRVMGRRALIARNIRPDTIAELERRRLIERVERYDAYRITEHGLAALGKIT